MNYVGRGEYVTRDGELWDTDGHGFPNFRDGGRGELGDGQRFFGIWWSVASYVTTDGQSLLVVGGELCDIGRTKSVTGSGWKS